MTSEKLFNLADMFAGKALRGEALGPEALAMVAEILRNFAEITAGMEACVVAPEVCGELAEIMHDAA
jgi:hypothetical protein